MATPLWIVNFAKKDTIESFFAIYWKAILQNTTPNKATSLQWFHITDGDCIGNHQDVINQIARRLTEDTVQEGSLYLDKLIPSASSQDKRLNVVFIGDLTDSRTLAHFHTLATELRANLLGNNPWSSLPIINFYGLLWRPNTFNFTPGVPLETQAFLNELNTLMNLNDTNLRPFKNVFLFESSVKEEEKEDAMKAMALATLHIALGHKPELNDGFVNAGMAGMFYEKEVQKEKEAFLLSHILISNFTNSKEKEFYDPDEATRYVDSCDSFLDSIQAKEIGQIVTAECPMPGQDTYAWEIKNTISPFNLNLKNVWEQYYGNYLVNLKRNLVNSTKKGVLQYALDYKTKLFANQHSYIQEKAKELEDKVFNLFSKTSPSKAIGIQQGIAVLDLFHERIKQAATELDNTRYPVFQIPENLKKAYEQAQNEHQSPDDTLAVLEGKLKNHPVFILSMLVRAIVLGFLLAYFGIFIIQFLVQKQLMALDWFASHPVATGTILLAIPIIWAFFRFNEYIARVKALKEQYVSCLLMKLRNDLENEIRKTVNKTYHELDEYCIWLRKNKLEYLQKALSVIPPSDFSFTESPCFQPILKCSVSNSTEEEKLLIPISSVTGDENTLDVRMTGHFNGKDILETPPLNNVTIQGSNYTLAKLETDNTQNLKSTLIKELLKSEATIYSNVEKNVQFGKRTLPNTKLLLLDISGSMSGSALEELKNAVIELSVHTPIKWIAFNDNVVCTSEEEVDLMSLQANGGTCYIPPLEKAREIMEDCYVDQVILISDGQPFESISEILEKAYGLNQPVNVISIGQSGVETMKELAEKTGGTQIVVENAAQLDTQLGNDLNVLLTAGEQGTFAFGDLLRKCHIPGCARALYDFSINRMVSARQSIAYLLVKYGNKEGLAEWGKVAGASCRYQQAGNRSVSRPWCKLVVEDGLEDNLLKKLYEVIPGIEVEKLSGMPDLFAFLLCMESIELKDLQWAGIQEDTTLINQKSQLTGYGVGSTEKAINIYGKEFTLKA